MFKMNPLLPFSCIFALSGVSMLLAEEAPHASPDFLVIINAQNPNERLERRFLADVFFKKVTRWPNDDMILPVDLKPDSRARRGFSETVLNRSIQGVKSYWQQLIFSGRDVPPPELTSDE